MSTVAALKADGTRAAALRVLMVEDNANDAELLRAHLASASLGGAEVLHARTLAEGLALLQSHGVQITLLDLDLPDSQGLQTLERVRAATSGPVIVVSGNGHPALVDEALKRRAYDVIPKDELDAATLRRVLRLATRQPQAGSGDGASEARYRALLESSSEALVLLDAEGRIQYASAAMRRILGYNTAQILGRTGLSFVQRDDREAVRKAFVALSSEPGGFATLRARFEHKNGGQRILESSLANRLGDADVAAIVCSYRDVTQEEEHRKRFAATFESSPVGLAHVDLEGRFRLVNTRLCAMLGYAAEELIGRTVRELSHPEDIDATAALRRQLRSGVIPQFTLRKRYLRKDGAILWVQLTVSLERDAQGAPTYDMAAFEDVTGAVRAEERLRESEARFRDLTAMSSDFYWETDAGHRMTLRDSGGSPTAQSVFAAGAPLGKRRWEMPFLSPDMRGWQAHQADLDAHRPIRDFEFSRPTSDGAQCFFSISGEPMFDEQGAFKGYRGVGTDITLRKSVLRTLELEHAVSRHLAEAESALAGVQSAIRAICELHNWDHGRFWQVDDEAGLMRFAAHWNRKDEEVDAHASAFRDVVFQPGQGIAGRVWQTGEPIWVADASEDPRTANRSLWRTPLRGTFMFPVRGAGKVLGVITIASGEIRKPDERLLAAVGAIGDQIGQFLLRKRSEEAMRRDISKRLEAERALRESEARFRSLTELSADWYWEQDAELRFISTGGVDKERGGITAAQHDGLRRWELPGTEPLEGDWEAHKAQLAARQPFRDFMLKRNGNDGKIRYVSISGEPIFGEGNAFLGYRGIAKDITQTMQTTMALRRFRAALDISGDAISLVDATSMRIIDINDAALRNLGYERHELLGQPVSVVFPDRSPEDMRAIYDRLLQSADGAELQQMHHRRKDGSIVPVEVTRQVLRTSEGTYVIGIARDLTERLRNEERLRSSHERFEMVSRATNDVIWDWNLVTDQIWWNDNFQKLFGYEPREVGAYADSWRSRIHPEDAARVKSQVEGAIRSGAKAWTGEYRFLCKDGSYLDVLDRGLLMHDERGRAVRMIGAMMDVSERKHAERHMRVHAERQAAIARFGQFALGRRTTEELYMEAARVLRWEGVDAVCVAEMRTGLKEYVVRAAQGDGPHAAIGQRGPIPPESVWPEVMRENASRIAGRRYLQSAPDEHPWSAWLRTMGSAIYVPVRDDDQPVAILCVLSREELAFGSADVRFGEAVANILTTALQRQKAEQRFAHLAQFDALTGLPNRTLLQDRLAQTIVQSRRKRWHAGALFVDLDRFKLINDTLGHHQGDALIRQVGERLLECVRPGDTVGRISGDEFAVVLADLASPDDAALVAQKVLDALARPFDLGGNEAYISASIGIAAFPEDGADAETLLKNADIAMYRAKESARNCYRFFTAEMNQRTVARVQLNTDLRRAIERNELTLHYQPKVDLADGKLRGLEALLRWNHPQRGMVSPADFIPALEDSGLILPVGEWVIGEACAQLRRWQGAGRAAVPVAVNLSPKQFRRGDLDRIIRATLARTEVDAAMLELEITESCLMEDPEDAVRVMHNLRAAGLRISIDDFGTGYSSLSYLTRLPLSALKVDRSFVRDAGASAEAASIVRAVIDMAQNLRFTVIAEGVETEQQVAFLRKHGCNQAQGYFFGRPACADAIGALLPAA